MDVARYLERLGIDEAPKPTVEGLNQLIHAHQCTIPFENLNVCDLHCGVNLDEGVLFDKVMNKHRGGYCFELNGLFCALLQELGFDAFTVFVRLGKGGVLKRISHRGVLVRFDGLLHYADVGKGDLEPRCALPLDGDKHMIDGAAYWITPDREDEGWVWMLRQAPGETEAKPYLRFNWTPRETPEFKPYSDALSESPDSIFWKRRMITLRTEEGFLLLRGDVYSEQKNGVVVEERTVTNDEASVLLEEKFGLAGF